MTLFQLGGMKEFTFALKQRNIQAPTRTDYRYIYNSRGKWLSTSYYYTEKMSFFSFPLKNTFVLCKISFILMSIEENLKIYIKIKSVNHYIFFLENLKKG